jgi:flagellar hook-associated protein 3 FlgL
MIAGIQGYNQSFLADLNQLENKIAQANRNISSGYRVNQASDDPSAIGSILSYQDQLAHIKQVQSNLSAANVNAQTADGALQTAATLLDKLTSLGASGASSGVSAETRATLAQQVQAVEEQLVSVANTNVGGHYIFGGDSGSTAPYTFDWTSPAGVLQNSTSENTSTLHDADGNSISPGLTAAQIFDARDSSGAPTANNIFNAAYSLGQALLNNDQAGIQSALDLVKNGVAQMGQVTTSYGNIQSWIGQSTDAASAKQNSITQALTAVRDTDVPTEATQLTLTQTALDAALAAHGNLNTKSLFSYLG